MSPTSVTHSFTQNKYNTDKAHADVTFQLGQNFQPIRSTPHFSDKHESYYRTYILVITHHYKTKNAIATYPKTLYSCDAATIKKKDTKHFLLNCPALFAHIGSQTHTHTHTHITTFHDLWPRLQGTWPSS